MKTTLYNHKHVGDKPVIPNVIYRGLVWLVKNKFFKECDYLISHYSLTSHQIELFKYIKEDLTQTKKL
jgi:hypothetical protein